MTDTAGPRRHEPVFNLPRVVTGLIVLMAVIHALRAHVLTSDQDDALILLFSFIPARYEIVRHGLDFPGGLWAEVWSPVTYAFLHGDWTHYAMNAFWMAAFGSAVAWRFGSLRFLAFSVGASVAAAAAFYVLHPHEFVPVVGASGAISGHMAAAARFVFQAGGPVAARRGGAAVFQAGALPLGRLLTDRRVIVFLGVWVAVNLLVGLGVGTLAGDGGAIAWEAHLGGFAFGLLAFSLFDPVRTAAPAPLAPGSDD